MPKWQAQDKAALNDEAFQRYILQGVSRTFALTIPQLPAALELVVGNAYLLCRIVDTIEDDANLTSDQKEYYIRCFLAVLEGAENGELFAAELTPLLSGSCLEAERELIKNTARVLRLTRGFSAEQQFILKRCVNQMAAGMAHFQRRQCSMGLSNLAELDCYCYHVAGVVGEMLADLFCNYSDVMALHRERLMRLSVHFGQGLQMVNILKDVRADLERGVSWLPIECFQEAGVDLKSLPDAFSEQAFARVVETLIADAHGHLRKALEYTLLIPHQEKGLRRFCLWAIGMAVMTLDRLNRDRGYETPSSNKITRSAVNRIVLLSNLVAGYDGLVKTWFSLLARKLPKPTVRPLRAEEMAVELLPKLP